MERIQIIAIAASISFLVFIARLIIKKQLREEYSLVWIFCTAILVFFSFWRDGLNIVANRFGVIDPPNLVFTGAIFAIMVYLLHISVVISRLQNNNKKLAQEIALLKLKITTTTNLKFEKGSKPLVEIEEQAAN